jgi:predicted DNA-binding transcriptional regulator YafY
MIEMIDLLRDRPGVTVPELAMQFGRSERSIYRWLSDISAGLRVPIVCRGGGYFLSDGWATRCVSLSPHELLALKLSLTSSPFAEGSPIRDRAESAWAKIRDSAPSDSLEDAAGLERAHDVAVKAPAAESDPRILETIERAVNSSHCLSVMYRSQKSNAVKAYMIYPYALVFRRHSWYVLAHSQEHGEVVQFKLVRFLSATETGETFSQPDDFSVDDYFRVSWEAWGGGEPVKVRVKFSPRMAAMIAETKRHPTQEVHPQPDGSVIFAATVGGIEEIAIWIMGYGRDAVVLEPESLRNHILAHAQGMLSNYAEVVPSIPA